MKAKTSKAQLELMDAYFVYSKNLVKFAINGLKVDSIGGKEKIK